MTVDWSNWKPGDPGSATIASEPGWLKAGLERQNLDFKLGATYDLDQIAQIVSAGFEIGAAESKTIKQVVNELGIPKPDAEFLVHFANCLASSQRDLQDSGEIVEKMEWDGDGCCATCQKNHGKKVKVGAKYPSGHVLPPACTYCTCCLLPVID